MDGCTTASCEWRDGKISMQMHCVVEGAGATAESRGSCNANGCDQTTIMRVNIGDTPVELESLVPGERIGDC